MQKIEMKVFTKPDYNDKIEVVKEANYQWKELPGNIIIHEEVKEIKKEKEKGRKRMYD